MTEENAAVYRPGQGVAGFSLLEMTITVVIMGFMMVGAMQGYTLWRAGKQNEITQDRIERVHQAITAFIVTNFRLPCPGSPASPTADPLFGTETDCGGAPGGATRMPGRIDAVAGPMMVRIGAVPVRALGLPDEYMFDSRGNRFTYAVTELLAVDGASYRINAGGIIVNDASGNPLTNPPQTAMYVLLSHGPDRAGGSTVDGVANGRPCDAGATDGENCDGDATFVKTLNTSSDDGASHFDDDVIFEHKDFVRIPAVTVYNLVTMPCTVAGPAPNKFGDNCATAAFRGSDVDINPPAQDPEDGVLLFDSDDPVNGGPYTSQTDGRVIIKAIVPAVVDNTGLATAQAWDKAILVALYIDTPTDPGPPLKAKQLLIDPMLMQYSNGPVPGDPAWSGRIRVNDTESQGFSFGFLMGEAPIRAGDTYRIRIYAYSFESNGISPGIRTGWAGTIRHGAHEFDGTVEILEGRL